MVGLVGVLVAVGVWVEVAVGVSVGVAVGVDVGVEVGVRVGVREGFASMPAWIGAAELRALAINLGMAALEQCHTRDYQHCYR